MRPTDFLPNLQTQSTCCGNSTRPPRPQHALLLLLLVAALAGCADRHANQTSFQNENAFPAAGDLALLVPRDDARIRALDLFPAAWLNEVDKALAKSELNESIALENRPDDWRLVSGRFVTCSPLGTVADPQEIDALCWPQIRLVWQPIVPNIHVGWMMRENYADDRAIHTLYRVEHQNPWLQQVLNRMASGSRWRDLSTQLRAEFARARDAAASKLLEDLYDLRLRDQGFAKLDLRSELNGGGLSDAFYERLWDMLSSYCEPTSLHELTAFSLPLGRNPASSNLWSFVAFGAASGNLLAKDPSIHDPVDGRLLFQLDGSENVTESAGDSKLADALQQMGSTKRAAILKQVVMDTDQLPELAPRINDPYQTLVPNTSCASCHRMNNLDFNFHNLSYLEDHDITIAPRVRLDIARELPLARALWQGTR